MKKQIKKIASAILAVGILASGVTTTATVYAANEGTGATGALVDSDYTIEEMLQYAMEDEYLAQAEYNQILETYGTQRPFSNIINAEAYHISLLEPLLEEYEVTLPAKDWESLVSIPDSLEAAYAIGVTAEENNIAMYEAFLKETLPDEVKAVFENLLNASEKHLAAFTRQIDGTCSMNGNTSATCNGTCDGTGTQSGKNTNGMRQNGQGNRGANRGSCFTEA